MSNKLRKMPKRAGPKSVAFVSRQADQIGRTAIINQANFLQEEEGDVPVVGSLTTGDANPVMIFLDDERPCPEGWTLARTAHEFFKLLSQGDEFLSRVTALSFDWNLGGDVTGIDVITRVAYKFFNAAYNDQVYMPNLKRVNFHSSDREQALRMSNILREVLESEDVNRMDDIRFRSGLPA